MWPTPYLEIDLDVLLANIDDAAADARRAGIALRPHAKTHKCPQVAGLQRRAGAVGLTVATIGEAETFLASGFDDLFIAYPLWVDDQAGRRLRALVDGGATLRLGADSVEALDRIAAQQVRAQVVVEIDSGHHRSGCAPEDAATVADHGRDLGLDVVGVFTFPGHSYAPDARAQAAADEARALATARDALLASGHDVRVVSGGSTPSLAMADASVLTEARPGVYCLNDAQQVELGSATFDDVALTCVATVVSRRDGVAVLDAGSKALGADRAAWATGYGRVLGVPDARIVALSEHHATIEWPGEPPALGERVRIVPNHVCNAVNLHEAIAVPRVGGEVESWLVAARGRLH